MTELSMTDGASTGVAVPDAATPPPPARLVSVVITCHNHARFLEAAIASAAAQTHRPLEIIVVDDGSTDGTAAVLARHPEVEAVRQENLGLPAARNAGLALARGGWVTFLDADDLLLPHALEAGVRHLSEHPECALVSGGYQFIDRDGRRMWDPRVPPAPGEPYLELLRRNYIGMHATVLYRREALVAVGGFDPSLAAAEDYDVFLKIARRQPIARHDRVVALYRRHGANMSEQHDRMLRNVLAILDAQDPHCRTDPARSAALRQGRRFWLRLYGPPLLGRGLRRLLAPRSRKEGIHDMETLYRHAASQIPALLARAAARSGLKAAVRWLPAGLQARLHARWRAWSMDPPVHAVDFGALRRVTPISRVFGFDRGQPIDRHYIEAFLERHAGDIGGRVLEVGDNAYTIRFSGDRLVRSDVLNIAPGNPLTTVVADLADAGHIPSDSFDSIIVTQTLHLVYDLRAAVATLHRILKPGGVLLVTVPGISQVDRDDWAETWYWSLTDRAAARLFQDAFPREGVTVTSFGNVLAATAFLHGLASEELERRELDHHDACYPVIVAVRAVKARA